MINPKAETYADMVKVAKFRFTAPVMRSRMAMVIRPAPFNILTVRKVFKRPESLQFLMSQHLPPLAGRLLGQRVVQCGNKTTEAERACVR